MISEESRLRYQESGFLIVESLFTPDEVKRMREALSDIVDQKGDDAPKLDLETEDDGGTNPIRRLINPLDYPVFQEFVRDERILSILRTLLGKHIRRGGGKINMKPARVGTAVEWHQDWAFNPYTNDSLLTVSVFIDDVTLENAPILVLPGSHRGPTYDHHYNGEFVGVIDPDVIRRQSDAMVPMIGPAGSCSFHHVRLVHGSDRNRSDADRRMFVFPAIAGNAWPLAASKTTLEQMYGTILSGNVVIAPKLVDVPVRIPVPIPKGVRGIFQAQALAPKKYFE